MGPGFEKHWPGASALATECVLNLYVAASLLEARSEASVREAGFPSLAAFNVLTVLEGARKPLSPSTIAERTFVTRGTMTGILGSLERHGLVQSTRHPVDGRSRLVEMTPGTLRRVRDYLKRVHAAERRLMTALTADRQHGLLEMLAILQRELDRLEI